MKKLFVLALALLCSSVVATGADIQKLIQDTQRFDQDRDATSLVWWIPTEFWEESLRQDPSLSAEARAEFVKVLQDYTVLAVIHARVGAFGGLAHTPRDDIMLNLEFLPSDGGRLDALGSAEMNRDAANFFSLMKPMMANMLGQFGEGLQFIAFPNTAKGKSIINATQPGGFEVKLFGKSFKWRLPLGSLLPNKIDPATAEVFPGNYLFNPFTGDKLVLQDAAQK